MDRKKTYLLRRLMLPDIVVLTLHCWATDPTFRCQPQVTAEPKAPREMPPRSFIPVLILKIALAAYAGNKRNGDYPCRAITVIG